MIKVTKKRRKKKDTRKERNDDVVEKTQFFSSFPVAIWQVDNTNESKKLLDEYTGTLGHQLNI